MLFLLMFNITLVRGNTSNPGDFKDIDDAIAQVERALNSTNKTRTIVAIRVGESSKTGLLKEIINYQAIQEKANESPKSKDLAFAVIKLISSNLKIFKKTKEALERHSTQQQLIENLKEEINSLEKLCQNKGQIIKIMGKQTRALIKKIETLNNERKDFQRLLEAIDNIPVASSSNEH